MNTQAKTPRILQFPTGETLSAHLITAVRDFRESEDRSRRRITVEYVRGLTHAQISASSDSEALDEFFARARDHHLNPFEQDQS